MYVYVVCVVCVCVNVSHLHTGSLLAAVRLVRFHIKIKRCRNILTSPRFCFCFISAALCDAVVFLLLVSRVSVAVLLAEMFVAMP